jgi:hypothetical protein
MRAAVAAGMAGVLVGACGGSPSGPASATQPPAIVQPGIGGGPNLAPVIDGITVSSARTEVDTDVTLTATVRDAETLADQLRFEWKADAGAFSGTGPSVTWRAPTGPPTPRDYTITLTVTETYGTPDATGVRPQNVVNGAAPSIRVHNSPKELGDLSLRFLQDFGTSSVPASVCVRDFSDTCAGKGAERQDIEDNRRDYTIIESTLNLRRVAVAPSRLAADVTVACAYTSRVKACRTGTAGCVVGAIEKVSGDCILTGVYEQRRWWLCDSHFSGALVPSMRAFFGIR